MYVFCLVVLVLSVLDIFKCDIGFSELENRNLNRKPDFTLEKFLEGKFSISYDKYLNDQFIFRDNWIDIKSKSERILGKVENNNIILGKDGCLFDKVIKVDEDRLKINLDAVNKFIESTNVETTVMIVPNSYEIYKDKLYYGLNLVDQTVGLQKIYKELNGNKINLIDLFNEEKNNYIYYKTDHHWTSYGAYLAYKELVNNRGLSIVVLDKFSANKVEGFYGTYFSRAKPYDSNGDILTYYDIPNIEMKIDEKIYDGLYDLSKLEGRNKYEIFTRGNNPLTIIKNKALDNNKKLLIFKDSYANSLVPFLTQNYEEIHMMDLRSFSTKVSKYIKENNFDDIFIVYNFTNFISDLNLVKIKY